MLKDFKVYIDEDISNNDVLINNILTLLSTTFNLKTRLVGLRIPYSFARDSNSDSYDALKLLESVKQEGLTFFLWLIDDSLTEEGEQTFGVSQKHLGAILSAKNLLNKEVLIINHALYLTGLTLGLSQCGEPKCVMKKVDNIQDVIGKENALCRICKIHYAKLKQRL